MAEPATHTLNFSVSMAGLAIRTLSVERLDNKIGAVSAEELALIIDGLYEIVGD